MCECIQRSGQPERHDVGCEKSPTPHKHAKVIKAWADGAEIEYKNPGGRWSGDFDIDGPRWRENTEYRIKPKPLVKKYLFAYFSELLKKERISNNHYKDENDFLSLNVNICQNKLVRLDWTMIEVEE